MNNFKFIERSRAYVRAIEHLRHAHGHLRAAMHLNIAFALGLDLPSEKPIVDAIDHCAFIQKLRPEHGEGQPPDPAA